MDYNQLVAYIQNLVVDNTPSSEFTAIFPAAIEYAEDRIFRSLDALYTRTSDTSVTLTPSNRSATCPSNISVVEGISLLTPVGTAPPLATRTVLERASLDFIDFAYGNETTTGTPTHYALKTDTTIVFGPTPASAWKIEITGTGQPAPISESNPETWLSLNLPDLLVAAIMVFMTGWQQNFGAQADNPQMSQSWEGQYKILEQSAIEWIDRQKSENPNWTPYSPTPLSTPRT